MLPVSELANSILNSFVFLNCKILLMHFFGPVHAGRIKEKHWGSDNIHAYVHVCVSACTHMHVFVLCVYMIGSTYIVSLMMMKLMERVNV